MVHDGPTSAADTLQAGKLGHLRDFTSPDLWSIHPASTETMTPAQWARSVAVLEKELGLEGQPRTLVYHVKRGEDGVPREHLHVVWQRTDLETHTLRHDGWNYDAHKRAAIALEREFGHALAPRQRQPEALSKDERQQAKRTGVNIEQVKADLTAAWQATHNGQEFKTEIEAQGYVLAQGDRSQGQRMKDLEPIYRT